MLPISGKVLVADDDREVRLGVIDLLAPLGLELFEAESGTDALRVLRQRVLDAMVLDVDMPGCTGLEVLVTVRKELEIPCIFCTGRPSEGLEREALAAGAWAFLSKPIRPDVLRREVLRAVRHSLEGRGRSA
jgi:CheY-like chemotaxis protein